MEELKANTARTPISDIQAKRYGWKKENCEIWNGNLFLYEDENKVYIVDYFTKDIQQANFKSNKIVNVGYKTKR